MGPWGRVADLLSVALAQGFGVSPAHMIGVSALNAFVLRQALHRHHPLVAGSVGVLADMLFITLGTTGLGTLLTHLPLLAPLAAQGGAAFLFWHGWKAFRAARHPKVIDTQTPRREGGGPRQVAATALGLTLFNPHPYVDSVVLFGALSTPFPPLDRTFSPWGPSPRPSPGTRCSRWVGPASHPWPGPPGPSGGWTCWWAH